MLIRLALLTLLVPLLCVSLTAVPARAKGSSYIVGATVSGGTLSSPTTVAIRLPENLDDMFEIDAPPQVDGASLPYELTLHYDFAEYGGRRDWAGRYDGDSTLYFPESMVVGPGTWAAGWYTAVDVLAHALAEGVAGSTETQSLPSVGSGHSSAGWLSGAFVALGLLGLSILSAGFVWHRRGRLLLAFALLAAAMIALACDDDESAPHTTPTVIQTGGDDGFRAFALDIDAAVTAKDPAFFRQRMKTIRVDCSTAVGANQLGGPVCATPDEVYEGFGSRIWKTDCCGIGPADGVVGEFQRMFDEQLPAEEDEYGSGAARVYALNVRDGAYRAVIAALMMRPANSAGDGPLRFVYSTSWVFENGEWRMESPLIMAYVLSEEFLKPTPDTGYDAWERFDDRAAKREQFPELGVTIEYPADWVTNAAPMPYATCICTVIGPGQSDYAYGIQFWKSAHQLGCQLTCYLNIRALAQEATHSIDVNGHVTFRQEFERQRPLGLVNGDGDTTSYREILTVVPLAPIEGLLPEAEVPALFIDAFYRYGDATAEARTREALANLLASLDIDDE